MANTYFFVKPREGRNPVPNPSFETNTTGWTGNNGGAIARLPGTARRGYCGGQVTPTSNVNSGVYVAFTVKTTEVSLPISIGFDIWGVNAIPYQARLYDVTAASTLGTVTFTASGAWSRQNLIVTLSANTSYRIYIEKNNSANTGLFYVDGVHGITNTSANATYLDGDQPDSWWEGAPHASVSRRSANSRSGGTLVDLETIGGVRLQEGMGMPSMAYITQKLHNLKGELLRGGSPNPRVFTLTMAITAANLTALHTTRQTLVQLLALDTTSKEEPALFRYNNGTEEREIGVVYDAGFQGVIGGRANLEQPAVRLIAHDPFYRATYDAGVEITSFATINCAYNAFRQAGSWRQTYNAAKPDGAMYAALLGPDGKYYAGGAFANINSSAMAKIAVFDPYAATAAWTALGSGFNGTVRSICSGPDGVIYAAGEFTQSGASSRNRIAKWNSGGGTWDDVAAGGGANGIIYAIGFDSQKRLWATGAFTSIGGVAANRVAYFTGSGTWQPLGSGLAGGGAIGYCLAFAKNGDVYIGGDFLTANGATCNNIVMWDYSAAAFVFLANSATKGVDNKVYGAAIGNDEALYIGGEFIYAGGVLVSRVAKWDAAWYTLDGGVSAIVFTVRRGARGVYFGGSFGAVTLGPDHVNGLVEWRGSWVATGIITYATGFDGVRDIAIDLKTPTEDMLIAHNIDAGAYTGVVTAITNPGNATAYPMLVMPYAGAGHFIQKIKNLTTGDELNVKYSTGIGEKITIDTTPGRKRIISSYYGDISYAWLPENDLATFGIGPGTHQIMAFNGSSAAASSMGVYLRPTYWSAD